MDAEQGPSRALARAALHAVAQRASRTSPGKLRGAVALVHHRSGIVLAFDLGLFRRSERRRRSTECLDGAACRAQSGSRARGSTMPAIFSRASVPRQTAVMSMREGESLRRMSWAALGDQVRILATQMRRMGVRPGDRVAAVLPNAPAGGDRNPGDRQHWRHLELLRPGLRHQGRVGALQAAGAEGLFLRRCLSVRRQALRPQRRTARHPEGARYRRARD